MRILLVEDDLNLCAALRPVLKAAGFTLDEAHDGDDGLQLLRQNCYAAAILDRMLPGLEGLALLRQARGSGVATPVLMLTAMGRVADRVDGLDAGADDYLAKPFDTRELLARLRALTRRPAGEPLQSAALHCGDLTLDKAESSLNGPGGTVTLTQKEYDLLEQLCRGAGKLQTRDLLFGSVWGAADIVEEGNLDTYIHFVRRRLKTVGSAATIQTVRGLGYKLVTAGAAPC
ncbi:MAG: response regulator transcription factor [Gemmiger sp.]|nr:response regulator transcription factor [Gemmiger sp.]